MATDGCTDHELYLAKVTRALRLVLQHQPFILSTPEDVYNLAAVCKSVKQTLQTQPLDRITLGAGDMHITKLSNMLRWLTSYPGCVSSISIQQSQLSDSTTLGCDDTATYAAVAEQLLLFALEKATHVCQPPLRLQRYSSNILHTPSVLAAVAGAGVTQLSLGNLPVCTGDPDKPIPYRHVLEPAFTASLGGMTTLRTLTLRTNNVSDKSVYVNGMPYACALKGLTVLETLELGPAALPALAVEYLPPSLTRLRVAFNTPSLVDLSHLTSLQELTLELSVELLVGSALPSHITHLDLCGFRGTVGGLDLSVLSSLRELSVAEVVDVAELLLPSCSNFTDLVELELLRLTPSTVAVLTPIWRLVPGLLHATIEFDGSAEDMEDGDLDGIFRGIGAATNLRSLLIIADELGSQDSFVDVAICENLTDLVNLTSLSVKGVACMDESDPLHLTVLTALESLNLAGCAVDDTVITAIGCRLFGLRNLCLTGCGLSSISPMPALGMLSGLSYLGVSGNEDFCCTDVGLMMLSTLTNLTLLDVDRGDITDEGLQMFKEAMPQVTLDL